MTAARQDQLLRTLLREGSWLTGKELASGLGVTPRSVRSYITALNARAARTPAVESGPLGYRAATTAGSVRRSHTVATTPDGRLYTLIRILLDAPLGIDVYETAEQLYVSDVTLGADLARVRAYISDLSLTIKRNASRVELVGEEFQKRLLFAAVVHDQCILAGESGTAVMRTLFPSTSPATRVFDTFQTGLRDSLASHGHALNDLNAPETLLRVAIVADRVSRQRLIADDSSASEHGWMTEILASLMQELLGISLGLGDRYYLASFLATRIIVTTPGAATMSGTQVNARTESVVRELVSLISREFCIDLVEDEFIRRLTSHVQVLQHRVNQGAWSQNSLTQVVKASYPMAFDIAVAIAAGLKERLGLAMPDDEIAFIAMHVGGRLGQNKRDVVRLTATLICPGYHQTQELLRQSLDRSVGNLVEIVGTESSLEVDIDGINSDLIFTTKDAPAMHERVVSITPFLTPADVDRINATVSRVRRSRRLLRLRSELERYFRPRAFISKLCDEPDEQLIRALGQLLVDDGVVDSGFVDRVIERERLSSTAFIDLVAIPHAIGMDATRTSIAVGIANPSVDWGDRRVQIVLMVAFSTTDRDAFQTVFEQLTEVLNDRESVSRLARQSRNFEEFLGELVALIEN